MSLQVRLVLAVTLMLTLGLFITVGAIFGAMQDLRGDQTDDVMVSVALEADRRPGVADADLLPALLPPGDGGPVWRRLADRGDIPSFYQLRSPDGAVRETVSLGLRPDLPDSLPREWWPLPATAQNPLGAVLGDTGTLPGPEEQVGGGGPNWRVMTARLTGRNAILVLAVRTDAADESATRVRNIAVITSVVVLLSLALVSFRTVRTGLRPLEEIAATASAIGAGDLTSRVAETDRRTEVGRLGQALNAMLGQIEESFQARRQSEERLRRFVADASHELRTPITIIRGYAELFRRGASARPWDLADAMHRIESEAGRMGHLVDELLLLARLDQGRPLERDSVDLSALAAEAVGAARAVEPDRPVDLRTDPGVRVRGDSTRLRQVVDNLLANVRQHTPVGTPAAVRVAACGSRVVLEVADGGPGIEEGLRDRVFERFFRGEEGPRAEGGAGLGLSIVSAVVTAHEGSVRVLASATGGTLVRLCLPLEEVASGRLDDA